VEIMKKFLLLALALGCGGMAVDYLPDGGVDGTHSAGFGQELGQLEQPWCIGCLAGVSVPQNIPVGYGLRPITQSIGGRSTQFPACAGSESSMPHACRTPTGNRVWFANPPSNWGTGRRGRYWAAVETVAEELRAAGWLAASQQFNASCPWDVGVDRYRHTEVIVKPDITNSPHPLFKLALQGTQNTAVGNIKTYLACEIEFDFTGPVGIANNGGHCAAGSNCADGWSPANYDSLRQNAFLKALMRCVGLGGEQLPIYEHPAGGQPWGDNCWAEDNWVCADGGGDGLLRKEWFADGWWSQRYSKNCLGDSNASCDGVFPVGSDQFLSGTQLLYEYTH
jgi:hypothetical protein